MTGAPTPAHPPRPANSPDTQATLGLALDVAAVLTRHGYPAPTAAEDLTRLQHALTGLIHQRPDPSCPSTTPSRDDPATTCPACQQALTGLIHQRPDPSSPSRDDPATTCPACQTSFTPTGRQQYCSTPCRKTAFRRRHQDPPTTVTVPAAQPRRQITIYECPACGERLHGEQRCHQCGTFTRRIGIGGPCPHCDQPVSLTDLLDQEITISQAGPPRRRAAATAGRRR